jgi:hypothetical protein
MDVEVGRGNVGEATTATGEGVGVIATPGGITVRTSVKAGRVPAAAISAVRVADSPDTLTSSRQALAPNNSRVARKNDTLPTHKLFTVAPALTHPFHHTYKVMEAASGNNISNLSLIQIQNVTRNY